MSRLPAITAIALLGNLSGAVAQPAPAPAVKPQDQRAAPAQIQACPPAVPGKASTPCKPSPKPGEITKLPPGSGTMNTSPTGMMTDPGTHQLPPKP